MSSETIPQKLRLGAQVLLSLAFALGVAAVARAYRQGEDRSRILPGVILDDRPVGGRPVAAVRQAQKARESQWLERSVTLRWPGGSTVTTFNALGVRPASDAVHLWRALASVGRQGSLLHRLVARARARRGTFRFRSFLVLEAGQALDALGRIKARADRRARQARLDLANRRILPGP